MQKKLSVFLLSLVLLFVPVLTRAQQGNTLSFVEVDLWPEFDRPTMLVIYHFTIPAQTSLPLTMNVRIPAAVGTPNAVAVKQPDGALLTIPYTQEAAGDWSRLVFQATANEVQIEYYDPRLQKSADQRHFEYTWPGDYAVDAFNIEVQQPTGTTEMQFKPGMVTARQGDDNLKYYRMDVGPLTIGQQFQITLDYKKSTDELSASSVPVEPSGPLNDPNSGIASMTSILPWFLGGVGLLLIVGGGVWYWQSGRQKVRPQREPHRRNKPSESQVEDSNEGSNIYCHQCGKRAAIGDRFCRACGTELRIS
jgi:zinc-ribbon domain